MVDLAGLVTTLFGIIEALAKLLFGWIGGTLLLLFGCCLAAGCVASHQGDYEWGFQVQTGYVFTQHAPESEPATAKVDVDPLVENIIDLGWDGKDEPTTEPTEGGE